MDYKTAGVDIDAGNKAVSLIKDKVKQTFTPHVLQNLGGFAALHALPSGYKEPILVSCTDGVGTKVKCAIDYGIYDTVGIDLVAMCVNDLICTGAAPLFFLDYIACHKTVPTIMDQLVSGMTTGCLQSGCALIGGEMAEMGDVYKTGDFDLAGFSVGIVEKSAIIDGKAITSGDKVYALPSSGIHSNGYSLVRKVLTKEICNQHQIAPTTILEPTRIYVKEVLDYQKRYQLTGVAHITGGGLAENIERILPQNVGISLSKKAIQTPAIFKSIQDIGQVSDDEMYKVFNMGVGMVLISSDDIPETDTLYQIGTVSSGTGSVTLD